MGERQGTGGDAAVRCCWLGRRQGWGLGAWGAAAAVCRAGA